MASSILRANVWLLAGAAATVVGGATLSQAAGVDTTDPNLPVTYPTGEYAAATGDDAVYSNGAVTVILHNATLRPLDPVNRVPVGANETEAFNASFVGTLDVPALAIFGANGSGSGTGQTVANGKVGNTTGTFSTEVQALGVAITTPLGPVLFRESPTLASTGSSTITSLGGGNYHIDSFFDVFTELSLDGGQTWLPDQNGSLHLTLQPFPEPSTVAVCGLALAAGAMRRRRSAR